MKYNVNTVTFSSMNCLHLWTPEAELDMNITVKHSGSNRGIFQYYYPINFPQTYSTSLLDQCRPPLFVLIRYERSYDKGCALFALLITYPIKFFFQDVPLSCNISSRIRYQIQQWFPKVPITSKCSFRFCHINQKEWNIFIF